MLPRCYACLALLLIAASSQLTAESPDRKASSVKTKTGQLDKIFRRAENGESLAQFQLGLAYETGDGITQDYVEARRWYTKAGNAGDTSAQNNLGVLWANGLGGERDDREALRWYQRAALSGQPAAQNNLAFMYS